VVTAAGDEATGTAWMFSFTTVLVASSGVHFLLQFSV
jgi:hypothetical protein